MSQIIKPQNPVINWGNPITKGLLAAYPFSERGGSSVHDLTKIYNGTWNGTLGSQWSSSLFGNSGNFNGTNNYVSSSLWTTAINSVSMGGWFKSNNFAQTEQTIISNGDGRATTGRGYAILLSGNGTTDGSMYILNHFFAFIALGFKVADNNWHQIILTVDGSSNSNIYFDGTLKVAGGNNSYGTPNVGSYIGISSALNDFPFNGLLDNMAFWNRALTASEIKSLYTNPFQIYQNPIFTFPYTGTVPPIGRGYFKQQAVKFASIY